MLCPILQSESAQRRLEHDDLNMIRGGASFSNTDLNAGGVAIVHSWFAINTDATTYSGMFNFTMTDSSCPRT